VNVWGVGAAIFFVWILVTAWLVIVAARRQAEEHLRSSA
jgi:hypothetical protein